MCAIEEGVEEEPLWDEKLPVKPALSHTEH
jgi:hypothetical protein